MEEVINHVGIWGFVPPFLAIALALITKDVIFSLFLGILSGAMIWAGGDPIMALVHVTDLLAENVRDDWNIRIFLFCALLGGLVGLLSRAGSAQAFGMWAGQFVRGRRSAQLWTFLFGILVFIDDYFNSLAVGSVMRPITDRKHVSRAKLSYILDSTAAPICIIAPISSWVVTVMSQIRGSSGFDTLGMNEMTFFIKLIPYNLYAIFSLIMVAFIALSNRDFGPMADSEALVKQGMLFNEKRYGPAPGQMDMHSDAKEAKWYDMVIPMIILVLSCVIAFPYTAWADDATYNLYDAYTNADAAKALFYGVIFATVLSYIYFVLIRRTMTLKMSSEAIIDGTKSMAPALAILMLAWTIGFIIKQPMSDGGLGVTLYIDYVVRTYSFPMWLLPFCVFVLSGLIAFSTGTSWGTFGIMIPITLPTAIALATAQDMGPDGVLQASLISVAAVLSGAVFGDHSSPISDTTILSSAGGGCPHLEHVTTQFPYALFVAICSGIGIIVGGLTFSAWAAFFATAVVFIIGFYIVTKRDPEDSEFKE